jgi:hypothetical protein
VAVTGNDGSTPGTRWPIRGSRPRPPADWRAEQRQSPHLQVRAKRSRGAHRYRQRGDLTRSKYDRDFSTGGSELDRASERPTPMIGAAGGSIFGGLIGFLLWIVIMVWIYNIAKRKGRHPIGWVILGFFFSLIALVVLLLLPSKRTTYNR